MYSLIIEATNISVLLWNVFTPANFTFITISIGFKKQLYSYYNWSLKLPSPSKTRLSNTATSLKCSLSKVLFSLISCCCCWKSPFFLCLKWVRKKYYFMCQRCTWSLDEIGCHSLQWLSRLVAIVYSDFQVVTLYMTHNAVTYITYSSFLIEI